MITINNLTMGFTERTLFKDVSLSIFPKEKIGLTGPNGAGKTTLFSIILGEMESLSGNVQIQKNINIGYLPQESHFHSSRTVMEELVEGDHRIRNLMEEKRKFEEEHKADQDRYGDILVELEQLGIYQLEHKAEKVLSGLGFKQEDFHRPVCELSGGWQMRTLLAKLLTYSYDLLLLDEPTNYLDLQATLWLKDYLKTYVGAFILISHDRVILNEVTNYTIVLDGAQMFKVKGNYESFALQKDVHFKGLEKRQKTVEKKRKQLEGFAQRFHAQPNRASAVRNKRKMIDRLEKIDLPQDKKSITDFSFSEITSSGYVIVNLRNVSKAYDEKRIYKDLDLEIVKGQKICLVGPNGSGKSTMLKMMAGAINPDKGDVVYGHQVDAGYFSQTRTDVLTANKSAFDEVMASAKQGTPALRARSLLGLFNFHGDDVFKPVSVLSGGEKSRLILAKLLINPPNFMLLDEPTTHLDLEGVKALTKAFQKYEGTICFISHDLYFIREIADHIIEIQEGQVKSFHGNLDYYIEKKGQHGALTQVNKKKIKKEEKEQKQKKLKKEERNNLDDMHLKHNQAKKRISQIKNQLKLLEKEGKDLELESYAKSRKLTDSYENRDADLIRDLGRRLKDIQTRQRVIETTIKELIEERACISR